jgi:glycosyltransferase involved in cell wall biosynthesis
MILRYNADGASSRVRGVELAASMRRRVSILTPDDTHWRRRYYLASVSPRSLYIQKRSSPRDVQLARLRRRLRFPTVFDIDDAPGGVRESPEQEALTAAMMGASGAVTVGSQALEVFASRYADLVERIPSAVDTEVYRPAARRDAEVATIGWIGNGVGYRDELEDLARVIARARERVRLRVAIVGAMGRSEIHEQFAHEDDVVVDSLDWSEESAIADAVREFDIGVYPLRDTRYNSFKCGYKAIQYMAAGLPVVASPTGENASIVRDGESGHLVEGDDAWIDRVCQLAGDPGERVRMGEAGRRIAVEHYSLERAAAQLDGLYDRIEGK